MDPFVAEVRIFPFSFAPSGWAFCNGQILPISQNAALFSLLGTYYGGNGQTTFGLPNLQGSVPLNAGQGPGLSLYALGEAGGSATVNLLQTQLPAHTHSVHARELPPPSSTPAPANNTVFARSGGGAAYTNAADFVALAATAITSTGGNQPHNNLMPYLALNFCIALQGVFPVRN
jgi:microcystin-dependent protein